MREIPDKPLRTDLKTGASLARTRAGAAAVRRTGAAARVACAMMACAGLAGCPQYPSPGAATPALNKTQVSALAKCQQAISQAQATFAKTKLKALGKCVKGVLPVKTAFENGLGTPASYDAGIQSLRGKCTKAYAKITTASTTFVDSILEACGPVETLVLGSYDGLRLQSSGDAPSSTLEELAGVICSGTEAAVDAQLWLSTPRLLELLEALGPEFVIESTLVGDGGFPNVVLDPRCPPVETLGGIFGPTP